MSNDSEVKGTQRLRVERQGGKGTHRLRVFRHGGEGNPTPRCLTMRKRREPNADVSNDKEAEGPNAEVSRDTQAKGPNASMSNDAEAEGTQPRVSRAAWLCSSFLHISMYIHTTPRRTTPPWGQYIHLLQLMCDAPPMKRNKIKLVEISQLGMSSIVIHCHPPITTSPDSWKRLEHV